jgi:hypothetical protein
MLLSRLFPQLDSDFTISSVAEVKAAQPKLLKDKSKQLSLLIFPFLKRNQRKLKKIKIMFEQMKHRHQSK